MRIAIVGCGGVGGYFGGRLAWAGADVTFIARGAHLAAMQRDGLRIDSPHGNLHVAPVKATDDTSSVGPVDIVFFTVKLYDTAATLGILAPLIGPSTLVIPFQNGVDSVDTLTRVLGASHVAGGTAYVAAVIDQPGRIRHTTMSRLVFGPIGGPPPHVLEELRALCHRAGFDATLSEHIQVDIWTKFARLTVFSGMTSIARSPMGVVRADPVLSKMMEDALHESIRVAGARHIPLAQTTFDDAFSTYLAMPPHSKSSMLEDLERGRPLELPWLSGAMVRIAEEVGVDVPTHRLIVALLTPHVNGKPASR